MTVPSKQKPAQSHQSNIRTAFEELCANVTSPTLNRPLLAGYVYVIKKSFFAGGDQHLQTD